jgi:hypothetical protein
MGMKHHANYGSQITMSVSFRLIHLRVCVIRQEFIMAQMTFVNQNFARGIFISALSQEME